MDVETIGKVEVHEAASLFPLLKGQEYKDLVADIKANGITTPLIYRNGVLVDGRNRLRAAQELGIPDAEIPKKNLKAEDDLDVYELVWTLNMVRRHLNEQQRAAIKVKHMEKTGELAKLEAEAEVLRKEARKASAKAVNESKKNGTPVKKKAKTGLSHVTKQVALRAGVSTATADQVMRAKRTNPIKFEKLANPKAVKGPEKRGKGVRAMWRVPNDPQKLAAFVVEKWTDIECRLLAKTVLELVKAAAAA